MEFFNHNLRLWVQEEQKKFNLAGRGGDEGWVGLSPVARGGGGLVRLLQLHPGVDVPPPFGHWGPGKLQGRIRSFCQRGDQVGRSYHPYLNEVQDENGGRAEYSEMPLALGRNQQALVRDSVGSITP